MTGLLSAEDLQRMVARHELERMEQDQHARTAADESKRARMDMLRERRKLTPDMVQRAVQRWQAAASQGVTEVELLRFPSELCSDDGRAINNGEPEWVHTLIGVPAQIYEIWEQNLKPRGFKLKASIVDFPNGKPGDVGMYLSWY
jgi:hypothetical protein